MRMEITEIKVSKIFPNPRQPRKEFNKQKLVELGESIKQNDLINPIRVKQVGEKYQIVCGEMRWRAHKLMKLPTIKCIIKDYNSKQDEMVDSLIENLHRTDLNSIEKENFISELWETGKYKSKVELGKFLGFRKDVILTNIDAREFRKKTLPARTLSTRTIRETSPLKNLEDRKKLLKMVESKKVLAGDVRLISKILSESPSDVKKAFFSDKINMKQAEDISKVTDEKTRRKLIQAHKEIQNIDKGLEKSISKKLKQNLSVDEKIKTAELLNSFRQNSLESQKINKLAIKNLMRCMYLINIMDDKQLNQLKHYQELFEISLSNILELSENLREKIGL